MFSCTIVAFLFQFVAVRQLQAPFECLLTLGKCPKNVWLDVENNTGYSLHGDAGYETNLDSQEFFYFSWY